MLNHNKIKSNTTTVIMITYFRLKNKMNKYSQ